MLDHGLLNFIKDNFLIISSTIMIFSIYLTHIGAFPFFIFDEVFFKNWLFTIIDENLLNLFEYSSISVFNNLILEETTRVNFFSLLKVISVNEQVVEKIISGLNNNMQLEGRNFFQIIKKEDVYSLVNNNFSEKLLIQVLNSIKNYIADNN